MEVFAKVGELIDIVCLGNWSSLLLIRHSVQETEGTEEVDRDRIMEIRTFSKVSSLWQNPQLC